MLGDDDCPPLRVGAIAYVNSLPFFLGIKVGAVPCDARLVYGVPTELNQSLRAGTIDVSLISSAEWLRNRDAYEVVGNHCIGAADGVMSVCLYTRYPVHQLTGKTIAMTPESASSTALLQVLCHHYWGVTPTFVTPTTHFSEWTSTYDAFLLIGNSSLLHPSFSNYETMDLASAWYRLTELPFTFAVMAAHKRTISDRPACIASLEDAFQDSIEWSQKHPDEVRRHARTVCPIDEDRLKMYFHLLHHTMTPRHHRGLQLFDKLLATLPKVK